MGIKGAAQKPINLSKTTEVVQGPDESPGAFLECLQEAYWTYAPFDLAAPENSCAVDLAFVAQAAPDTKRKLQSLEGFAGMNISQILEIAQKVFDNREFEKQKQAAQAAERAAEKASKRQAKILGAVIQGAKKEGPPSQSTNQGTPGLCQKGQKGERAPLRRKQCAFCKQMGHWETECPLKPEEKPEKKKVLTLPAVEEPDN